LNERRVASKGQLRERLPKPKGGGPPDAGKWLRKHGAGPAPSAKRPQRLLCLHTLHETQHEAKAQPDTGCQEPKGCGKCAGRKVQSATRCVAGR
jgi:hypothetical protein